MQHVVVDVVFGFVRSYHECRRRRMEPHHSERIRARSGSKISVVRDRIRRPRGTKIRRLARLHPDHSADPTTLPFAGPRVERVGERRKQIQEPSVFTDLSTKKPTTSVIILTKMKKVAAVKIEPHHLLNQGHKSRAKVRHFPRERVPTHDVVVWDDARQTRDVRVAQATQHVFPHVVVRVERVERRRRRHRFYLLSVVVCVRVCVFLSPVLFERNQIMHHVVYTV